MHSTQLSFINIIALLFGLLLLLCFLAGTISALFWIGKKYGAGIAVGLSAALLMLPVLGVVVFASFQFVEPVETAYATRAGDHPAPAVVSGEGLVADERLAPAAEAGATANGVQVNALRDAPPVSWVSSMDLGEFHASLYPGIVECAEPLAQKIGEVLQQQKFATAVAEAGPESGVQFFIRMEDDFDYQPDEFVSSFLRSLQRRFPNATLTRRSVVGDKPMTLKSDEVSLTLSALVKAGQPAAWNPTVRWPNGDVLCRIETDSNTANAKIRFDDKPWVNRLDEVVSRFPQQQFVVGFSSELASSESQARQSAMENVQSQVELRTPFGRRVLVTDVHVADRFAQKLSRPYGDVWREAVLVDVAAAAASGVVQEAGLMAEITRGAGIKRATTMSIGIFLLSTIGICFVANLLTQGYYRKPIRHSGVAIVVLVLLGGLLFVQVREGVAFF